MTPRSTKDLVVLMVAGTLCATLVLAGAGVALLALARPDADLSGPVANLGHAMAILVGALAGYLAGRGRGGREP